MFGAMVVAQLVGWLLLSPNLHGSNPDSPDRSILKRHYFEPWTFKRNRPSFNPDSNLVTIILCYWRFPRNLIVMGSSTVRATFTNTRTSKLMTKGILNED